MMTPTLNRNRLFAAFWRALPTAAALHTLVLFTLHYGGRIRGVEWVAVSFVLYPLSVGWALWLEVRRIRKERPAAEANGVAGETLTREPAGLFFVCVALCSFIALGSNMFRQAAAGLFFADACVAVFGTFMYLPLNRLNQYVHRNTARWVSSGSVRYVFRFNDRFLLAVCCVIAAVSVSVFLYKPRQTVRVPMEYGDYPLTEDWEEPAEDPDQKTLSEIIGGEDEETYDPVTYIMETNSGTRLTFSGRRALPYAVTFGVLAVLAALLTIRRFLKRKDDYLTDSGLTVQRIRRRRVVMRSVIESPVNTRIRRLFRQTVETHQQAGLRVYPASTSVTIAADITARIEKEAAHANDIDKRVGRMRGSAPDISVLEGLYRRARYDGVPLTEQDVPHIPRR